MKGSRRPCIASFIFGMKKEWRNEFEELSEESTDCSKNGGSDKCVHGFEGGVLSRWTSGMIALGRRAEFVSKDVARLAMFKVGSGRRT